MHALMYEGRRGVLHEVRINQPAPCGREVLLRVRACGVCRTDLHIVDGDLPPVALPIIPGHEIIGEVVDAGPESNRFTLGQRVGVPWLAWTCGSCRHCIGGRENLCAQARFTGYHQHGGYAQYALADERYCLAIPAEYSDVEAAPMLCAGLIGYRALRAAGDGRRIGLYGFGAAAHIICQVARGQGREVYAFTRPGDREAQDFALRQGAVWAGDSTVAEAPLLDAAILFAPAGGLVPAALRAVDKGGTVVCAGIHMTDIPSFPYEILWGERVVRSIANLTRRDGEEFFDLARTMRISPEVRTFDLTQAPQALVELREGRFTGAAVLRCD